MPWQVIRLPGTAFGKQCESVSLSVCQKLTGLVKNGLSSRVLQVQLSRQAAPAGRTRQSSGSLQIDAEPDRVNFLFDVNGMIAYIQPRLGWTGKAPVWLIVT
jgi:hypothetical protein